MAETTVPVSEAQGALLDCLVALALGWTLDPARPVWEGQLIHPETARYALIEELPFSTQWRVGGPLLPRFGIRVMDTSANALTPSHQYQAEMWSPYACQSASGFGEAGYLIAAMRALASAHHGSKATLPAELLSSLVEVAR